MTSILKKLKNLIGASYSSYRPQNFDQIAFDENVSDESFEISKVSARGETIMKLLNESIKKADDILSVLPDIKDKNCKQE